MTLKPFDLEKSPVDGTNLIEASAGTGKTYTIAGLYLRLVLEKKIPVEKILVVTFTEAATEELKDRVRNRLKDAETVFEKGYSDDPFLSACLKRSSSPEKDLERLKNAIVSFDQASVFTIHGFCQRALVENAFESGALFETELVTDTSDIILELVRDYFRNSVYEMKGMFADFLGRKKSGPDHLTSLVMQVMKPGLSFFEDHEFTDTAELESSLDKIFSKLEAAWFDHRRELLSMLSDSDTLNQSSYRKSTVLKWAADLDFYLSGDSPVVDLPETFKKGCTDNIEKGTKKGKTPPSHFFFDLCYEFNEIFLKLETAFSSNLAYFRQNAVVYVEYKLEKIKNDRGILFFDDLLTRLAEKIEKDPEGLLVERISTAYEAALIDEFQDTDPVQYTIFSKVFGNSETPFFMIGDPKQAIYGFRGADIFAYMKAAAQAENRYTLDRNYRSDPGLVAAVNSLFKRVADPFIFSEISFFPVKAVENNKSENLVIEDGKGRYKAPLTFHTIYSDDGREFTKGEALSLALHKTTEEIVRLLDLGKKGLAAIGEKNIEPHHIAVLVRTNYEALKINEALNRLHIPSVIYDTGNIFESHEAMELETVLSAVLEPGRAGVVKAALSTDIIGMSASELFYETDEKERFEIWTDKFRDLRSIWFSKGFSAMFQTLVKNHGVKERLMIIGNGHRRNTNLMHLFQLMHKADLKYRGGAAFLLEWLKKHRINNDKNEEHQLRLEQDDGAVTVVTIHKSKGMEYPIVFLPFLWNVRNMTNNNDICFFHKGENKRLFCDFGSELMEDHKKLEKIEEKAENLRLLYVALTRAKKQCHVVWGRVRSSDQSAFAHLLYNRPKDNGIPANDDELSRIFSDIEDKSCGTIKAVEQDSDSLPHYDRKTEDRKELVVSSWKGHIEKKFSISSFSSLTSRKNLIYENEIKDRDLIEIPVEHKPLNEDLFINFPRGARPGTFLHDIFEHLDFSSDNSTIDNLVKEKLDAYRYEQAWHHAVSSMVRNVLDTHLLPDDPFFKFSDIKNKDRINELEFYFPVKKISPEKLSSVFTRHNRHATIGNNEFKRDRFDFQPVKGFMRGFMDLVFRRKADDGNYRYFIVDWKSNFTGQNEEDYCRKNLERVMTDERYDLQYLIYTVALDRYLKLKLGDSYEYKNNFGGVFYVFLRGINPENNGESGIYHDIPEPDFIKDLSRLFWEE